jgi:hypothetical protein
MVDDINSPVAKAARVLPHSRATLRAAHADITRRIALGEQPLGVFGKSLLGFAIYFEALGATEDQSRLLAAALIQLVYPN